MGVSTCLIGTHMFTHFPHNLQKYTGKEKCEMLTSENEEIDRTKTNTNVHAIGDNITKQTAAQLLELWEVAYLTTMLKAL